MAKHYINFRGGLASKAEVAAAENIPSDKEDNLWRKGGIRWRYSGKKEGREKK